MPGPSWRGFLPEGAVSYAPTFRGWGNVRQISCDNSFFACVDVRASRWFAGLRHASHRVPRFDRQTAVGSRPEVESKHGRSQPFAERLVEYTQIAIGIVFGEGCHSR